jgi:hypothetical protein
MGRKPAPVLVHRLSLAEQRVLTSFIAGRLPAGQVYEELQRARIAPEPTIEPQPKPAPVVQPVPVVVG